VGAALTRNFDLIIYGVGDQIWLAQSDAMAKIVAACDADAAIYDDVGVINHYISNEQTTQEGCANAGTSYQTCTWYLKGTCNIILRDPTPQPAESTAQPSYNSQPNGQDQGGQNVQTPPGAVAQPAATTTIWKSYPQVASVDQLVANFKPDSNLTHLPSNVVESEMSKGAHNHSNSSDVVMVEQGFLRIGNATFAEVSNCLLYLYFTNGQYRLDSVIDFRHVRAAVFDMEGQIVEIKAVGFRSIRNRYQSQDSSAYVYAFNTNGIEIRSSFDASFVRALKHLLGRCAN